MLSRFISDSVWGAPEYIYPFDNTVSLKNVKLYTDGNLNVSYAPFLENLNDFANNNFSNLYLTQKKPLSSIALIQEPTLTNKGEYPGLLGLFAEKGEVTEQSVFLECLPLYRHINDFYVFYASFRNSYKQLSGGSLFFSTADPPLSGIEIGFSIDGQLPIYNFKRVPDKHFVVASNKMSTTAAALTSKISQFNFCKYLSGFVNEFSQQQSLTLTISSNTQGIWNSADLLGYAFTLGNTFYGDLTGDVLNFYRRFALVFKVQDPTTGAILTYTPPGYNPNERYTIPDANTPPFTQSTPIEDVVRALSGLFGEVQTGSKFVPTQLFFDVKDVRYDVSSLSMTITHKLCGSVIEPGKGYDGLDQNKLRFAVNNIQEGKDSGFGLRFGPKDEKTVVDFKLPTDFTSYNTIFNLSAISDFELFQIQNYKEYSYIPRFVTLFDANNNVFLDINFISDNQLTISHTLYERGAILVTDDLNKKVYFIDRSKIDSTNIDIAKFNYFYDDTEKRLIAYKIIDDGIYALGLNGGEIQLLPVLHLHSIPEYVTFNLIKFGTLKTDFTKNLWASYQRSLNTNNLNLDLDRSFNISNNFLFHTEYNTISSNINVNFLPLKNQLNEIYNQSRKTNTPDFREYHSLYTGDNTETGNLNISLGYTTTNIEYILKSGDVTWFHVPYNESFKSLDINDANFVVNGAVPGLTPVFSDKIWKKAGDYRLTSNLGGAKIEQTGRWLCAWLSGGDDGSNAVWVDRFYNPEIITEIEAIKFTNNIDYRPSYSSQNYSSGITDRRSTLKLESGVWFAYNHVGKKDAEKVISYIKKDIVQEGLIGVNFLREGQYKFAGRDSGYISLENYKAPLNNFTLSFFGYSDDWNKPFGYQLLGNYMDSGFGIFNFEEINPITYYFNRDVATMYNVQNDKIFSLTVPPSLSGKIVGMFRRSLNENFHVVLDTLDVLEYDLNGTLVDTINGIDIFPFPGLKPIISVANNTNVGVVLFADLSYCKINLRTNVFKYFEILEEAIDVGFDNSIDTYNVCLDPFDTVYIVKGRNPMIRVDKLYYIDTFNHRIIKAFNTLDRTTNTFIDTSVLETPPVDPYFTAEFLNKKQELSEVPYVPFNLTNLSGVCINIYPPNFDRYSVGFSIYREPYIFRDTTTGEPTTRPNNLTIPVDLNGNYWYLRDSADEERYSFTNELQSDSFGYSTHITDSGLMFFGDPDYQDVLGSTTSTFGKVFVYNTKDMLLNPLPNIDLGGKSQEFDLFFNTLPSPSQDMFFKQLTSFPLSANIIFSNGSDVFSHPYGEGSNRAYVSAFSLAFTVSGVPEVIPYHRDRSIFTKLTAQFIPPLTSVAILVHQLTGIFNTTEVFIPQYINSEKQHLSSYFDFTILTQDKLGFSLKVKNKFRGVTPLSARGEMIFTASNAYTNTQTNSYTAIKIKTGLNSTGQDDQKFGYEIESIPAFEQTNLNTTLRHLFISSPTFVPSATNISQGKVTVYKEPDFSDTEFTFLTSYDILSPRVYPGMRFGNSLRTIKEGDVETIRGLLFIGAPVAESFKNTTPTAYAYLYDLPTREFEDILFPTSPYFYALSGSTAEGFAQSIGITREFLAVSSPLSSGNRGGLTLYRYNPAETSVDRPWNIYYRQNIGAPVNQRRFRFGTSFDISYDYLAVASLSSADLGAGNIVVDLFKNNHVNMRFSWTQFGGRTFTDRIFTQYEYLSTIGFQFTNSFTSVSTLQIDIKIKNNYLTVGAWTGDFEKFGGEEGKVVVYEIHKDVPIRQYEQYFLNRIPIRDSFGRGGFKTYFGRSVSLVDDRLITGTSFIYNTGNSTAVAVSALNTALKAYSKGLFGGVTNYIDGKSFITTITTYISSFDRQPPVLFDHINQSYQKETIFRLLDYYPGSELNYSGEIMNFNFNLDEETVILTDFDRIKTYDQLGNYKNTVFLKDSGLSESLSCIRFGLSNLTQDGSVGENYSFIAAKNNNEIYKINFIPSTRDFKIELIDANEYGNPFFFPHKNNDFNQVIKFNFDITNSVFMESNIRMQNLLPKLNFKIRLNNRLDFEEANVLNPVYLCENLAKGWHHFAIILDSVNGEYRGYIDTKEIFKYNFDASKYVFSTILKNNILVGASPFYNNVAFDNFYKSKKPYFAVNNLTIDNIKFYNASLNQQEIKFLSYDKFPPADMKFQLDYGSRNYVDTITRVSRHKLPGKKSPFIDIVINDSLITNKELQSYYETLFLRELKEILPSYIRINKITWVSNKESREKITEGDINIGNTLTDTGIADLSDFRRDTAATTTVTIIPVTGSRVNLTTRAGVVTAEE